MEKIELRAVLCWFVLEMHKKNREQYPTSTVNKICCGGIMRYSELLVNRILSFKDISFCHFRELFDTEIKQLQREGVGQNTIW